MAYLTVVRAISTAPSYIWFDPVAEFVDSYTNTAAIYVDYEAILNEMVPRYIDVHATVPTMTAAPDLSGMGTALIDGTAPSLIDSVMLYKVLVGYTQITVPLRYPLFITAQANAAPSGHPCTSYNVGLAAGVVASSYVPTVINVSGTDCMGGPREALSDSSYLEDPTRVVLVNDFIRGTTSVDVLPASDPRSIALGANFPDPVPTIPTFPSSVPIPTTPTCACPAGPAGAAGAAGAAGVAGAAGPALTVGTIAYTVVPVGEGQVTINQVGNVLNFHFYIEEDSLIFQDCTVITPAKDDTDNWTEQNATVQSFKNSSGNFDSTIQAIFQMLGVQVVIAATKGKAALYSAGGSI